MLPHMTLYTTNFPAKNEKMVINKLREMASSLEAFPVTFNRAVVDMLGVWINAEITSKLQSLHEHIVDTLNLFRDGLYDEGELVAIGENKGRQKSLVKYGMWAAKDLYIPHITLSRPHDSACLEEALRVLPSVIHYTTTIKEIAYVERGIYRTCKQILQRFSLN